VPCPRAEGGVGAVAGGGGGAKIVWGRERRD